MKDVKGKCVTPFRQLKRKVQLLERAQQVNILIRKYQRFEFDFRKLAAHVDQSSQNDHSGGFGGSGIKDYAKAAHTIRDLEMVINDENSGLTNIPALQRNIEWIRMQGDQLRRKAGDDLRLGIRDSDTSICDLMLFDFIVISL